MAINLFLFTLVLRHELGLNVFGCFGVVVFALVFGKAFSVLAKRKFND
jgi:hypothetical protein